MAPTGQNLSRGSLRKDGPLPSVVLCLGPLHFSHCLAGSDHLSFTHGLVSSCGGPQNTPLPGSTMGRHRKMNSLLWAEQWKVFSLQKTVPAFAPGTCQAGEATDSSLISRSQDAPRPCPAALPEILTLSLLDEPETPLRFPSQRQGHTLP